MDFDKITISNHAKERYAERIMNREDKVSVTVFITNHEEKIHKDICKMLEYGEVIYRGQSQKEKTSKVAVYLKGCWIVIFDETKNVVVTLFNVDLGVGDDFNQEYVTRVANELRIKTDLYNEFKATTNAEIQTALNTITDNKLKIEELTRQKKLIEAENEFYESLVTDYRRKLDIRETELRDTVELLTAKKVF